MHDKLDMHPILDQMRQRFAQSPGRAATFEGTPARAAVAVVFRLTGGELELLMIRRAEREGDPWSGHVALPGGRYSPGDASLLETARREAFEETGVDLRAHGVTLGMLDELHPRSPVLPAIVVTPYVFVLTEGGQRSLTLALNAEVAEAFWVPLAILADPDATRETDIQRPSETWRVQAFMVGDHVVWGLTERILRNLLTLIG
ncbi:MAG: CoA pyrophosphatase [Gemmatimonadaceae bacterium]